MSPCLMQIQTLHGQSFVCPNLTTVDTHIKDKYTDTIPSTYMSLSLGNLFTNVITEHGNIYGFGQNSHGEIGTVHFRDFESASFRPRMELRPVLIDFQGKSRPVMMAAGSRHTVCLAQDGSVWTWGNNAFGQTSGVLSTDAENRLPISLFDGKPVIMVACGSAFSVVLTGTGQVWNCGMGNSGELGHGDSESKTIMTLLDPKYFAGKPVTSIAAGFNHTMALCSTENTLYTWGCTTDDDSGFLGREKIPTNHEIPLAVAINSFNNIEIISMSVGHDFGVVVTADGAIWACGKNDEGQLGLGDCEDRVFFERVAGSELFGDGGVRMTSCQAERCMVLSKIGKVWICGRRSALFPTQLLNTRFFTNAHVVTISSGVSHSALIKNNGKLYTWGMGMCGALGFGNHNNLPMPRMLPLPERVGHNLMHDANRAIRFALGNNARLGENTFYVSASAEIVMLMYTALRFKLPVNTAPGLRILLGFDSETIENDVSADDEQHVSADEEEHVSEDDEEHVSTDDEEHVSADEEEHVSADEEEHVSEDEEEHVSEDDEDHVSENWPHPQYASCDNFLA